VSCDSPLYIRSHSKAVLNRAIEQDTKFLADNSVMDYSLLVGLEPSSDELVLGIIGKNDRVYYLYCRLALDLILVIFCNPYRLYKNVHVGQKVGDDGEKIRYIGWPR